jgi:hypothetical protein
MRAARRCNSAMSSARFAEGVADELANELAAPSRSVGS